MSASVARQVALLLLIVVVGGCSPVVGPPAERPPVASSEETSGDELARPRIAEPDPNRPRYQRDEWQPHGWADADSDCLNTRHEVLIAESRVPVQLKETGCSVVAGEWADPFTGVVATSAARVEIDHLVSLGDSHRSGGWAWPQSKKVAFANDLSDADSLNAAAGAVNQRKADHGPDRWLPSPSSRCWYVSAYARIKTRWDLTVTPAQWEAIETVWAGCPAPNEPA